MQPKGVSAGMLLLVGAALSVIQLTSLVLGPAPSRQLNLSLAVPAVELDDAPGSVGTQADTVLGTIISISIAVPATLGRTSVAPLRQLPWSPAVVNRSAAPSAAMTTVEPAAAAARVTKAPRSVHDDHGIERRRGKIGTQD